MSGKRYGNSQPWGQAHHRVAMGWLVNGSYGQGRCGFPNHLEVDPTEGKTQLEWVLLPSLEQ